VKRAHRRLGGLACLLFAPVAGASCAAAVPVMAAATGAIEMVPVSGGAPVALHVPAGRREGPLPLVLFLHGSSGEGVSGLDATGLVETADQHGFLVAAPTGGIALAKGFAWNVPGVPTVSGGMPDKSARDDVAYLNAVIADLVARKLADPARVYVTGLSGGGRMASWLACVEPERFAAVAPVVGLRAGAPGKQNPHRPDPASCRPSTPISILAFAGDHDTTNPMQGGGAPYWQYSMSVAEQRWASLNGCSAVDTHWLSPTVYEQRFSHCPRDIEMSARVTAGGQHNWKVADNDAMWAFFSRHSR